jgi:alkanesulfonate monooxygenase SsuD/methylene tetrahydromethanopterin reductase-like flavin-dependent oxidoreductase (luciferase family)
VTQPCESHEPAWPAYDMTHQLRFGLFLRAESPWTSTLKRCRKAEALGFDSVWTGDTMYDPFRPGKGLLDCWTVITAWAAATSRIRIGTLISNIIFRTPALLARQAASVDHISAGRLELGIGAGMFPTDHTMNGIRLWSPRERSERLAETIEIVDRLLRGEPKPYSGRYYSFSEAVMAVLPVQQPRPPLTIAASHRRSIAVAAIFADSWNTFGGLDLTAEQHFEYAAQRARILDECCAQVGRDPQAVRRSILVYSPLDPWESIEAFRSIVGRYRTLGFSEFILYWPHDHQMRILERAATEVIPALRERRKR